MTTQLENKKRENIFLEDWIVEITKNSNKLTEVSFEHREENEGRIYDLKDNFVRLETDEENNRFDLYTKEGLQYHFNLSEEGSIFGDIFDTEGELIDTFAMFNIYD